MAKTKQKGYRKNGIETIEGKNGDPDNFLEYHNKVIKEMDAKCQSMIKGISRSIASIFILPVLREMTTVTDENGNEIKTNAYGINLTEVDDHGKAIVNDIAVWRGKLATLYIKGTTENQWNVIDQFSSVALHENYITWINGFINAIVSKLEMIETHLNEKLPSDKQINLGINQIKGFVNDRTD